jgi:hypothetical protein
MFRDGALRQFAPTLPDEEAPDFYPDDEEPSISPDEGRPRSAPS